MVVLISAMQRGLTAARLRQLRELVGVSHRTVARWRDWWIEVFTESPFWRTRGALVPSVKQEELPTSLLQSFKGACEQKLLSMLRFLAPVTTGRGLLQAI